MNAIYRLLPLMMFICLCLMLWQYVSGAKDGILDFLARWLYGHIKVMDCRIPKEENAAAAQ